MVSGFAATAHPIHPVLLTLDGLDNVGSGFVLGGLNRRELPVARVATNLGALRHIPHLLSIAASRQGR